MKLSIDSFHYKWYRLTYTVLGEDPPRHTNLCQYARRLFFSPLLFLCVGTLWAFAGVVIGIRALLCYPFGYSTNWKSGTLAERKPALFHLAGSPIYLGHFILPIATFALNYFIYREFRNLAHQDHPSGWAVLAIVIGIFEAAVALVGTIFVVVMFFSSDTWDLFQEWFNAKTQGVCPLIEFDAEEKEEEEDAHD